MANVLNDEEIAALIAEVKPLPNDYKSKLKLKSQNGFKRTEIEISGATGNKFSLMLRQSEINMLDFSVILGFYPPKSKKLFRLRRYNGKSHEHRNGLEKNRF